MIYAFSKILIKFTSVTSSLGVSTILESEKIVTTWLKLIKLPLHEKEAGVWGHRPHY